LNLTLNGIQRLDGSLTISSCATLIVVSAPQLQWINYNLTLSSCPELTIVNFPALETVKNAVSWTDVPSLISPNLKTHGVDTLGNPGTNLYGDLTISGTGLKTVDFFNFGTFAKAGDIIVTGNTDLWMVNLSSLMTGSTLQFADNGAIPDDGKDFQVLLPNLTSVGELSLKGVFQFDFPALTTMDATLWLEDNLFQAFELDQLNAIGGDVVVTGNQNMNAFNLPALTQIGGGIYNGDFVIANNSALTAVDGLGKLAFVDGVTNLSGNLYKSVTPFLTL
jgi:hypothetical protein